MQTNQEFQAFYKDDYVYSPDEIKNMVDRLEPTLSTVKSNKKTVFYNIPASFDIETTSLLYEGSKVGIMYEWTLGLNGLVMVGRTWQELSIVLSYLINRLKICEERKLIIYVHNLAFEFQFLMFRMDWKKVFALDTRKPVYADSFGLEFRCSYILSGYNLATIGKNLQKYPCKKMEGDLDYSLLRHSGTPLTEQEIGYCVNDVKVVMCYIQEKIEQDGDITRIPLTKTGYVRKFCRRSCFYGLNGDVKKGFIRWRYTEFMKGMTLDPTELRLLERAFQGGFTHSNPFMTNRILRDVTSYDLTSSYPTVMVAEEFPMSKGELIHIQNREEFDRNLKLYCCVFDLEVNNLKSRILSDSYISLSRCWDVEKPVVNNGRIVSASHIWTSITNVDFSIISRFYEWDSIRVKNFYRYRKDYLPKDFVEAILSLYKTKTELKGIPGKEVEYLSGKEMVNSAFGMIVTSILRPEINFDKEWKEPTAPDIEKAVKEYNESRNRFLFYPWGVFVTAYARRNVFTAILECAKDGDYCYCDTDSVKITNADKHMEFFDRYNQIIRKQLYWAMDYHGLPRELVEPMNKKGEKKCLGLWDFDGHYKRFKTLGAKRYLVEYSDDLRNGDDAGKIKLTVSGLSKQKCVPWMQKEWGANVFEKFDDDLYVPPEHTGKMIHSYVDESIAGQITDYQGHVGSFEELSSVHLEDCEYSLSLANEYVDYFSGVQELYL